MAVRLDLTDLKILKSLQKNGRITNLQLSSEIGLSPAPTLERVRKLEKNGYIKNYHAEVDAEKLGIGITAFIQVSLARQMENFIEHFVQSINKIDEITECYQVTGSFDYQLKVMVDDMEAFNRLISEKLSKVEEIGQMQSFVILKQNKSMQAVPVDYELDPRSK